MLSTKLESFIKNDSIDDVITWISNNVSKIYQTSVALLVRFRELHFGGHDINTIDENTAKRFIDVLYLNNPNVSEIEYQLLESVTNSIYRDDVKITPLPINVLESNRELVLYTILRDYKDIMEDVLDDVAYRFISNVIYGYILDVYIPSSNPEQLIFCFNEIVSFKEVMTHINDTNWFIDKYNTGKLLDELPLKNLLLLFKYTSDIYLNRDMKMDFFFKLHDLLENNYAFKDKLDEIALRYNKFFHDDTMPILSELVQLSLDNSDMDGFLYNWCKKYHSNVPSAVMKCMISDCISLAKYDKRKSNYEGLLESLIPKWDEPVYSCDPVEEEAILFDDDTPITTLKEITMEAVHKDSPKMNDGSKKIYKAYRTYQSAEEKVDSQISKALGGIKRVLTGDVRSEIIEGKKFSAIGLLKQLLGGVAIFSTSKIAGVITVVVSYALKKKTSESERKKIIMELETEIAMITEKIEDARGDNNREAKYAMMRTKKELENALKRIQYGIEADVKSTGNAKKVLNDARGSM